MSYLDLAKLSTDTRIRIVRAELGELLMVCTFGDICAEVVRIDEDEIEKRMV